MEAWVSGLNLQFTKLSFLNWNREFESHRFRMKNPLGFVHGRFQPPHNGHIRYILSALEKAEHVRIGICTPKICTNEEAERTGYPCTKELNPYSYEERVAMLTLSLTDEGVDASLYSFIPFPSDYHNIETILPKGTVFFISKTSADDDAKIREIEKAGFKTEILMELTEDTDRERSGHVRDRAENWEKMVPKVVADYIHHKNLS